ncbi:MAG: PQQ-binding-like beta-propeller repeat protein, partial [Euryarchaeota archaeon]
MDSSPAIVNGVVYVGSWDSNVYAIGNQPTPTRVTLAASSTTPAVNQKVTFTAKLYWWNPATNQWVSVSGKSVNIY